MRALQACHGRVIESRRCGFLCSPPSPPAPLLLVVGSECVGPGAGGGHGSLGCSKVIGQRRGLGSPLGREVRGLGLGACRARIRAVLVKSASGGAFL